MLAEKFKSLNYIPGFTKPFGHKKIKIKHMKSILYVGATLMIGASIYGFVDYKQNMNKKEFKEMYGEEKAIKPIELINDKTTEPVEKKEAGEKQLVGDTKKGISKKQEVSKAEEFKSIKPIASDEKIVPAETRLIEKTSITNQVSNNNGIEKKKKKKRKFNTKLFSRGALDERYVNPKEKVELIKEDLKKPEIKEQ